MIESLPTLPVMNPMYGLPGAVPVYTGGTYGYYAYGNYLYNPLTGAYYGYASAATDITPMPKLNSKTTAIGKLSIPSVGMNKYIYEGTGKTPLSKGVGHFGCTPGWDGNIGLAGHNSAFGELLNSDIHRRRARTLSEGHACGKADGVGIRAACDEAGVFHFADVRVNPNAGRGLGASLRRRTHTVSYTHLTLPTKLEV